MGVIETLRGGDEPSVGEGTPYQCVDCGSASDSGGGACSECGGRIRERADPGGGLEDPHSGPVL